jgi:type VI secretion system protein ImpC
MNFNVRRVPERPHPSFRILVLADFGAGARDEAVARGVVTPDNYGDVSQRMATELDLEVQNHLSARARTLRLKVPLADLSDLSPAGLIANIPELTTLFLFRERLQLYLRQEIGADEFLAGLASYEFADALAPFVKRCRDAVRAPAPEPARAPNPQDRNPPRTPVDSGTNRILDLVETAPAAAPVKSASGVDLLAASLTSARGIPAAARSAVGNAAHDVTALLNRQISAILHHPDFLAAESTWRGLRLLLDHTVNGAVRVELIDAPRGTLESALTRRLNEPAGHDDSPPGLIVADFEFGADAADIAQLQRLATAAYEAQVPLAASASQDFFGQSSDPARPLPFVGTLLDQPRYTAWNALRDKECARWLCLGFNHFAARDAYTAENTRGLDFTEATASADNTAWGRPGWIIAALVARSVNQTHWPTQITGMQRGQITQLPLRAIAVQQAGDTRISLRAVLTMQNAEDLAGAGFAPLLCQANRDCAYLLYAPTVRRPSSHARDSASDFVSLPYQLFVARITETLRADRELWSGSLSPSETAEHTQQTLNSLLADTGPNHAAHVTLAPDPDRRNRSLLQLDLHAGGDILNGAAVQLTIPV